MDLIKHPRALLVSAMLALGVLLAGVALTACGSDNNNDSGAAASDAGNGTDRAFVADMIPHHKSAVEMARIAKTRGRSTFVKNLASDIIRTQNAEITTMKGIAAKLDTAGVKAKSLGIAEHMMGMDMNVAELRTAKPFDRAFIDMMIPHHQGAIRMARVELAKGSSPQAKKLATQIIAAQTREIDAMNMHRTEAFGSASPAGGVPAQDETMSQGDGMTSMKHG
jgi:uncharacterized protein (DUF305 family)